MKTIAELCPKEIHLVLSRLHEAGYDAYAVGGCIRDSLLGREPNDWDVTTSALPEDTLAVFRDLRTIPTGLQHGTVTVLVNKTPVEITTFRVDGEYTDSRHPESVTFSGRIEDDLSRRDFTINALAWNERSGVIDCFDGLKDLERKVIRAVGEPQKRFEEDALRILRGYRFAAQISFEIEKNTRKALISEAFRLKNISRERISSEFCRLIAAKGAVKVLRMLDEDGIFPYILPAASVVLPPLAPLETLPPAMEDRLGYFFYGSDAVTCRAQLNTLRLSNKQVSDIETLADLAGRITEDASPYAARKLLSHYGDLTLRALAVAAAHGKNTKALSLEVIAAQTRKDCVSLKDLAIGGRDLIAAGLAKGSAIGVLLGILLDEVLRDPAQNTRETLLEVAKNHAQSI